MQRKKCLEYMNKGDMDSAKMFAEGAIKAKKEAINVRRFGIKMSALSSKVEAAARTQQMSETMKNTIPLMSKAMKQMEKSGVSNSIADFEKVFEDMEVKTGEMDSAMDNIYSTSIDQGEVSSLMQQVQEEAGILVQQSVGAVGTGGIAVNPQGVGPQAATGEVDDLQNRLNALQGL